MVKGIGLRVQRSLGFQIIFGLTIIMVAALTFLGLLSIKISERFLMNQKIRQGEMVAAMFMATLPSKDLFLRENYYLFENLIEIVMVKEFIFIDKQGVTFRYKDGFIEAKDYRDSDLEATVSTGEVTVRVGGVRGWFLRVGEELSYYSPWIEKGEVAGGLKIVLPLNDIKADMTRIGRFLLFFIFIDSMVLIIFGVFLLSKTIIKPIKRLEETARRIAGGGFEERVSVSRKDEIGGLSESFNVMADGLQEKLLALEKANRSLLEAQKEVIRTEKMATIGRLAAGIAHEIGNPLGAIQGYIDLLLKGVEKDEEMDILQRLGWETERINSIITNFLDISRPARIDLKEVDVNKVISDTIDFFKDSMKGVTIELALNDKIPLVKIDEGQLRQVMINMILNAVDSMPKRGRLSIETGETELIIKGEINVRRKEDPPYADYVPLRSEIPLYTLSDEGRRKVVRIGISDTGYGIKEEDLSKIFDPFFTTKKVGKGSGLGLTVSLGIVQAFGGEIKVESKVGKGTTFEIFLPV